MMYQPRLLGLFLRIGGGLVQADTPCAACISVKIHVVGQYHTCVNHERMSMFHFGNHRPKEIDIANQYVIVFTLQAVQREYIRTSFVACTSVILRRDYLMLTLLLMRLALSNSTLNGLSCAKLNTKISSIFTLAKNPECRIFQSDGNNDKRGLLPIVHAKFFCRICKVNLG